MNRKRKGSRNELKAKALLEKMGYEPVTKSGGSLGIFDLIGLGPDFDHALLIQVRSNRKPGKSEMDLLKALQCPGFCRKQAWVIRDYSREPVIVDL